MARAEIDYTEVNDLVDLMTRAADSEEIINEVLHESGSEQIKEGIQKLLPSSGRFWNGKKSPASTSHWDLSELRILLHGYSYSILYSLLMHCRQSAK